MKRLVEIWRQASRQYAEAIPTMDRVTAREATVVAEHYDRCADQLERALEVTTTTPAPLTERERRLVEAARKLVVNPIVMALANAEGNAVRAALAAYEEEPKP